MKKFKQERISLKTDFPLKNGNKIVAIGIEVKKKNIKNVKKNSWISVTEEIEKGEKGV